MVAKAKNKKTVTKSSAKKTAAKSKTTAKKAAPKLKKDGAKVKEKKVVEMTPYALPEVLDIALATEFYTWMSKEIGTHEGNIVINGKAVERITTPCVQVLISAAKTLEETGASLVIQEASKAMELALIDLGLATQLEEWSKTA